MDSGAGLQGGPITSSGTLAIDSPTCVGTDKLVWNGSAFLCTPDQIGSGTVTSVGSGSGLTGGPITAAGTLSVNAPTCSSLQRLTWTGAAFQCLETPADISARAWRTSAFSVSDAAINLIPFDGERWDTDNMHDPADATKLTAKTSGKYLICGHIRFAGNSTGLREVGIYKNGDPIATDIKPAVATGGVPGCGAICPTDFSVCTHAELDPNDYVELFVIQTSGGVLSIPAGNLVENSDSDFEMVKLP